MPIADVVVNAVDGSLYFVIGGRRVQSGLYRIRYSGDASTAAVEPRAPTEELALRRELERHFGSNEPAHIELALTHLDHEDRFIRFAARTLLEHTEKTTAWRSASSDDPRRLVERAVALTRRGDHADRDLVESQLKRCGDQWDELDSPLRLDYLRALSLFVIRYDVKSVPRWWGDFPTTSPPVNREIARLMTAANDAQLPRTIVPLLSQSATQEQQIHYALCLSLVTEGWTPALRTQYFEWFLEAARLQGGNSFNGFIRKIRERAINHLPADARSQALEALLARKPETTDPYANLKARDVVQQWTVEDFGHQMPAGQRDLARGQRIFSEAHVTSAIASKGAGESSVPT